MPDSAWAGSAGSIIRTFPGKCGSNRATAQFERALRQHLFGRWIQIGNLTAPVDRHHPGREVAQDDVVVDPHPVQLARGALEIVTSATHAFAKHAGEPEYLARMVARRPRR